MREVKKVWILYVEDILGWEAKEAFLVNPEKILEKQAKDDTLTVYEIEVYKRFSELLRRAGNNRAKIVGSNIDDGFIKDVEESCSWCGKTKDIGKSCWWCGS